MTTDYKEKNERRKIDHSTTQNRDARQARRNHTGQDHQAGVCFGAFGNDTKAKFNELAVGTSHPGR